MDKIAFFGLFGKKPEEKPKDNGPDREQSIRVIAKEIDKSLLKGKIVNVRHRGVVKAQHGLGGLETQLVGKKKDKDGGYHYSLHSRASYGGEAPESNIFKGAPKGFQLTLKKDSVEEKKSMGGKNFSIPDDAKTPGYTGDYPKIDWTYPHPDIKGQGVTRKYFQAVERGAKKAGYPSIHVDATNSGLSYWSRKEFGLKVDPRFHEPLKEAYANFKKNPMGEMAVAYTRSPYVRIPDKKPDLPDDIDLEKPHEVPREFWDTIGARLRPSGGLIHMYKKFDEKAKK